MATITLPEAGIQENKKAATKYVYFFGGGKADGNGKMKDDLGGKGAGLAEMTNAGLPVPPGFTIQTEACREYMRNGGVSKKSTGRWKMPWPSSKRCKGRNSERARIPCW